jgi:zinc transport system substrate-binding protein
MSLILIMRGVRSLGRTARLVASARPPVRGVAPALVALALAAVTSAISACSTGDDATPGTLRVVASAHPLAEAAERVGGDLASVQNLTPPGVEPHDLELAPDDLEAILTSDLVLVVGGGFQPAVEDAAAEAEGTVVDAIDAVPTLPPPGDGDEDAPGAVDPHVWLDPMRFATIVERVADELAALRPGDAEAFRANAAAYVEELTALDADLREGLATCADRTIVVSHAAFAYLADAYDLVQQPISGVSPESEPDPARLAELKELVEREGVTTIFTEELVSPDVAETLASEAGVTTAVLNPLEGLTQSELEAGDDYGSVMRRNLETLRGALGCA